MEHYFSERPESEPRVHEIEEQLLGRKLRFSIASGIFSQERVDPGSRLLIESCRMPSSGEVLDLGCGYGPVGISLALAHPKLHFILTDINRRAASMARKNIKGNKVANAEAMWADLYAGLGQYSSILCNPPMSAGRDLCLRIITEAPAHLISGGSLQIVSRQNKGGKWFSERMKETFGNVEVIGKKAGYWVYFSTL